MSHALVPVPASNEEHSCPVGNRSYNGAASYNGAGRVHLVASANIIPKRATVTGSSGRRSGRVSDFVGRAVFTWNFAGQRASSVDLICEVIDRRVLVVPEAVRRVAELGCECGL